MKIILTTLNAKYIHTSLALRLLYAANKTKHNISFCEYTIKENIENIANELLNKNCDIIGIGVYIWNVKLIKELTKLLKTRNPNLTIVLGGPEVSYEPQYFLNEFNVDFIISGEGEFALDTLLDALKYGKSTQIDGISSKDHISSVAAQADLEKIIMLDSPYQLDQDKSDFKNRLIYFETSRGCPYQCAYCLSSLEQGVRYYPEKYIYQNLSYLMDNGAKQIKFLDRTFNAKKNHINRIFEYLINNYRPGISFQFEIYAELLKKTTLEYLNKMVEPNYFRFEIGIQSTYEPTNQAVNRKQDFDLLAENIKLLMDGGKIDLHLDLIAGLPFETFDRFIDSFNDVFALGAKEVQLGFLKMLRGTLLRKDAEKYGYKYQTEAPYEILENNFISLKDLKHVHQAEHMLDKFWNSGRFTLTMSSIMKNQYNGKYFQFFDELGQYCQLHGLPAYGYQLEDLFSYLNEFLESKNIFIFPLLREDYYGNFSRRPQGFWKNRMDKKEKKRLLYLIGQDHDFLTEKKLSRKIIEKLSVIDPINESFYLLTIFYPDGKRESYHYSFDNQ